QVYPRQVDVLDTTAQVYPCQVDVFVTTAQAQTKTVIGAVCAYRRLQTKANIFIVNLAVADLIIGAVVQGFTIVEPWNDVGQCINVEQELCLSYRGHIDHHLKLQLLDDEPKLEM
ncbi:hypothetical protein LSAT2_028920, partial [Lamellibrachia satsuma]